MLSNVAGGVVIIVVATFIGIAQNTVRSNPVKLIQDTAVVSTVRHGDERAATAEGDAAAALEEETLPAGAIGVDDVKRLYDEGTAVIIDARAPEVFEAGHIPGAINIPYDKLPSYLDQLQSEVMTSDRVICYCWGPTCDFSDQLATELKILGYDNVVVFTGGWEHWTAAGHPTEGTGGE
jgi:rhodanese-related sulfurtransferase